MKNHTCGCQNPPKDADGGRDGVDHTVDERMEADSQQGYQPDSIMIICTFVAHKGIDEAIK